MNRETQARAVSPNSRAQLCLQAKDLDAFVFRKNLTCGNYSLANTWDKHLKLSGVLCLPKVNLWCSLETESGLRPGDHHTHLKAFGEKLFPSTWVLTTPKLIRKTDPCPLVPSRTRIRTKDREGIYHRQSPLIILIK